MAQAIFRHGEPQMIPYTPVGAITAGDVIIENGRVLIAHLDIAAGALGAVSIGGGFYDFLATSGDVIAWGDAVEWNDTTDVAEEETSGNSPIGPAILAKADGELVVRAYHALP